MFGELMESAQRQGGFVIETEDDRHDMHFNVDPADKPTRNKLQRSMPDGLMEDIEIPDNIDDPDDISVDDIDMSEVSITDMTFDEEATHTWLDAIAEHYHHEYYSQSEVRSIFNTLGDEFYISAGSFLIELGNNTGPVTGFRRES